MIFGLLENLKINFYDLRGRYGSATNLIVHGYKLQLVEMLQFAL